jgi:hypothetical protein
MKLYIVAFFSCFISAIHAQDQWVLKDSIKGKPRSVASAFTLNGKGYTVAGYSVGGFRRKMHEYTYWQDDWDSSISLGGINGSGMARGSASSFAIYEKGYVCLGQGETNPFFKDLWQFDPITNTWTQKADFIGSARRQAVAFTIDSFAYVGTGIDITGLRKDMFKYNVNSNTWTQINDFGGSARKEAVGFAMGAQGYIGTGDDGVMKNDFWQYQPESDAWIQKTDFPGTSRKGAVGWGIFPSGFICTGEDINFNYMKDLWEYNYYADSWDQKADYIGQGRSNAFVFVIQQVAFVGSGYNGEFFDDVYAYRRVLGQEEFEQYSDIVVDPNPAHSDFHINVDPKDLNVEIYTIHGKRLTDKMDIHKTMNGFSIDRGQLASGNYLIRLSHISGLNVFQSKLSVL